MARDISAASFAIRTPIDQMDRPSVERELRHAHGDAAHYPTAHGARDALAGARAAHDAAYTIVATEPIQSLTLPASTPSGQAPLREWSDADRALYGPTPAPPPPAGPSYRPGPRR